jgi:hypothetical protein
MSSNNTGKMTDEQIEIRELKRQLHEAANKIKWQKP